jgi:DNA polymerase-3 subunit epsilon
VSFASIQLAGDEMQEQGSYLVFDPRRDSDPEAAKIHGWDDWTLRFQDLFQEHAKALHDHLSGADLLVMHNAEFDLHFVNREFRKVGLPPITVRAYCTMLQARSVWAGQPANLGACAARVGLSRSSLIHSAFEDAFLTMNIFRFLQGNKKIYRLTMDLPKPTNFRAAPARPEGKLPRRTTKRRIMVGTTELHPRL